MSATNEEDMRKQLDDVTDDEVVEQRRRLEQGEEQPTPVILDARTVIDGIVEIPVGESLELPLDFDPSELVAKRGEGDRTMLVIGLRGLTENLFSVVIELGDLDGFDELIADVGERLSQREERASQGSSVILEELFFFDHIDGDHGRPGDIIESVSQLGHYSIDIADKIAVAAELGAKQPAVRLTVLPLHDEAKPSVPFLIGNVLIANVLFEF